MGNHLTIEQKNRSVLTRVLKNYERPNSVPAPDFGLPEAPVYDDPKDSQIGEDDDDYSFIKFPADRRTRRCVPSDATIDLLKDNSEVEYSGVLNLEAINKDLLTPKEATKACFGKIEAPQKESYLFPKNTAHGLNV